MEPTEKERVEGLVEWMAEKIYTKHHPRMFHTFEELNQKYHGSAEAVRNKAHEILTNKEYPLGLIEACECGGNGYEEGGDGAPSWHVVCGQCVDTGIKVIPLAEYLEEGTG